MSDQPHVFIGSRCTFCGRNELDALTLGPETCEVRDGSTITYSTQSGDTVGIDEIQPNTTYSGAVIQTTVPPNSRFRSEFLTQRQADAIMGHRREDVLVEEDPPGWVWHIDDPDNPEA